jgi:tetratricopeptide (TPR) repeat protein
MTANADAGPRTSSRCLQVEAAVELAMQGRWSEAADLNRRIVGQAADDVGGHNRLGRALEALGRSAEAREAYSAALAIDAHNPIAARGLGRLAAVSQAAPSAAATSAGSVRTPGRHIDYGRLETRVEEPTGLQDEYLEPYEEYETEGPEGAIAERIELAGELLDEARLEELEGAVSPDLLEEESQQEERDRALAAEEESDER